jgi:hypothetical protein
MITTCIPTQAKLDFLSGVHTPKDQYKVVFYTSSADLGPDTSSYTTQGEVSGKGYKAGGLPLHNPRVWADRGAACLTFDSVKIPVATITVRGFMVINASKANKAVFIADFGQEYTSTEGPFTLPIAADMLCFD